MYTGLSKCFHFFSFLFLERVPLGSTLIRNPVFLCVLNLLPIFSGPEMAGPHDILSHLCSCFVFFFSISWQSRSPRVSEKILLDPIWTFRKMYFLVTLWWRLMTSYSNDYYLHKSLTMHDPLMFSSSVILRVNAKIPIHFRFYRKKQKYKKKKNLLCNHFNLHSLYQILS